jgi:hypothetical protein
VTSDLAVRPMTKRHKADKVFILALTEGLFHNISIQTRLDYLVSGPIHIICYEDIFPEPIDISADPIMVLAKIHMQSVIF